MTKYISITPLMIFKLLFVFKKAVGLQRLSGTLNTITPKR